MSSNNHINKKKAIKVESIMSTKDKATEVSENRRCIVCVRGHVDTGKTSLVSKLSSYQRGMRSERLTEREAGGITQEVGLTTFSCEHLRELLPQQLKNQLQIDISIIDTPGHEAFESIRTIGSQIAHITLVMVDIVKGIDEDTLNFLKTHIKSNDDYDKTIIVLNKLDKISGFRNLGQDIPIKRVLSKDQSNEFINRLNDAYVHIQKQLSDIEIYGEPYYKKNVRDCIAYVPISAHTGAGISDLLLYMSKARMDLPVVTENQGFILDKRTDNHLGKILIGVMKYGSVSNNQSLKIGNSIFPIRNLCQNQDNRDSREHCFVQTDKVLDSTSFAIVLQDQDQFDFISIGSDFDVVNESVAVTDASLIDQKIKKKLSILQEIGVHVVIPSESMMDGIAGYFSEQDIKISNYSITKITKKDLIVLANKCNHDSTGYNDRYRCVLICLPDMDKNSTHDMLFDQYFNDEMQQLIKSMKINVIFQGTIYKLAETYKQYFNEVRNKYIDEFGQYSYFSAETIPKYIFNTSNPIIVGIKMLDGLLGIGSIVMMKKVESGVTKDVELGRVNSIKLNNKEVKYAIKGMEVSVKIIGGDQTIKKNTLYELFNINSRNANASRLVSGDIQAINN